MTSSANPTTSATVPDALPMVDAADCRRQGKNVFIPPGRGPRTICITCGRPAVRHLQKRVKWAPVMPPWLWSLGVVGLAMWRIFALIQSRTTTIWIGWCATHLRARTIAKVLLLLLLAVFGTILSRFLSDIPVSTTEWAVGAIAAFMMFNPAGTLLGDFNLKDVLPDGTAVLNRVDKRVLERIPVAHPSDLGALAQ